MKLEIFQWYFTLIHLSPPSPSPSSPSCFITHMYVFFGAFIGPIFLVLVFTVIMFLATLIGILCHSRKSLKIKTPKKPAKRKGTARMMFSLFGVIVLFGGSWVFAVFTVNGAPVTVTFADGTLELFHLLFVVFTSLQGLFIFLVFVVFSKEARELWLRIFCCRKKKKVTPPSSITGTPTKNQSEIELDDIDDKKDVEAAEEAELTDTGALFVNNQGAFSTLLQQPSDEQLHTQPAILHSRSDSGFAAIDSDHSISSPPSIKKEVEQGTHTTLQNEGSSGELSYNADITTSASQDHGIYQLATAGNVMEDRRMDAETLDAQNIATTKQLNGVHEFEQQVNDAHISEQLNGTHEIEQPLNGTHEIEQQLNATHEIEQQLNGTHKIEQQLNGTHEIEQQSNGTHEIEQQLNGIYELEQQLNAARGSNSHDQQDQREANTETSYGQDAAITEHQSTDPRESSYTHREENQTNLNYAWTSDHTSAAKRPNSRESISGTAANRPDSRESLRSTSFTPSGRQNTHWFRSQCKWIPDDELDEDVVMTPI